MSNVNWNFFYIDLHYNLVGRVLYWGWTSCSFYKRTKLFYKRTTCADWCIGWDAAHEAPTPLPLPSRFSTGDLNSSGAGASQPVRKPQAQVVHRAISSKVVFLHSLDLQWGRGVMGMQAAPCLDRYLWMGTLGKLSQQGQLGHLQAVRNEGRCVPTCLVQLRSVSHLWARGQTQSSQLAFPPCPCSMPCPMGFWSLHGQSQLTTVFACQCGHVWATSVSWCRNKELGKDKSGMAWWTSPGKVVLRFTGGRLGWNRVF